MAETLRAPSKATSVSKDNLLGVNPLDRVHVFIDATNLLGMQRVIERKIDFKLFMKFLKEQTRLVRASYFVLQREGMTDSANKVIDMIEYAGFDVFRKWGNEFQEAGGQYRFRGSIIPELTVAMIDAAEEGADHIILISGDGEMYAAVEACKRREARVTIVGVENTLSDDMRRTCDSFVELTSLEPAGFFYNG